MKKREIKQKRERRERERGMEGEDRERSAKIFNTDSPCSFCPVAPSGPALELLYMLN